MSATPKPKTLREKSRERGEARRAEAARKRQAEAAKKVATDAALARCRELAKAIPTGFSDWGVVRTQAWETARARCAEVAGFARPHLGKLQAAIGAMTRATTAPVDRLALDLYGTDEQKEEAAKKEATNV
jgi:hypothetical protein